MAMKVWVCETWETDGYDHFGEHITLWHKKEDAEAHGKAVADESTAQYVTGKFQVCEAVVL